MGIIFDHEIEKPIDAFLLPAAKAFIQNRVEGLQVLMMLLRIAKLFTVFITAMVLTNCSPASSISALSNPGATPNGSYPPTLTNTQPVITVTAAVEPIQTQQPDLPTSTITPTTLALTAQDQAGAPPTQLDPTPDPISSPTTAPDTRLTADIWRSWPTVPVLSSRARDILKSVLENPALDPHVFSKVGDCQFVSETFLAGYVKGIYPVPEGLEATAHYYKESMVRDSITAENGLGINSVLNPYFAAGAGYTQCGSNETPLACELRTRRPAVVLIAMGTNWKPNAEASFETALRQVVDIILASGALPILATKADNIEKDWKLNLAIARVAYDYQLPLVNVWKAVQNLPNHGLQAPVNVYLTGDGWMARNDAWLRTLDLVRQVLAP